MSTGTPILCALLLSGALLPSLAAQAVTAAQKPVDADAATTNDEGPPGIIPYVLGPNLSLGTSSQHDSSNGWSSVLTPDLAWRFDKHFSADVGAPFYTYINVVVTGGTKAVPTYTAQTKQYIFGDMALNGHYDLPGRFLTYNGNVSLGLPTGKSNIGLGAGQVTYNINNHVEKAYDWFTPEIEVGIGDSSALIDSAVRKSYTSVGTLGIFLAGASFDLPFNLNFESAAYENLPIGAQTLYSTTKKGKKSVTTVTGKSATEDNGFENTLQIPLGRHTALTGFYNRSLRSHIDTVGFSLTFFLRAVPHGADNIH